MAAFLALLLTGMLLGTMLTCTIVLPRLARRYLAPKAAEPFMRKFQSVCQRRAAAAAMIAGVLVIGQFAAVLLVLVGAALLLQLFWLDPAIQRYDDSSQAGSRSAMATANHLHRANLTIGLFQLLTGVIAFALILRDAG